jgi:hypothetical protein
MTGVEPANGGVTIHCLDHLATPAMGLKEKSLNLKKDAFFNETKSI